MFIVVLVVVAVINIFGHLLAVINNISVWWHVIGAPADLILFLVPEHHASFGRVFANASTTAGCSAAGPRAGVLLLVAAARLPILTQYTITGYDASAHLSGRPSALPTRRRKGIWRSIFYSAIGGWILLLAFLLFAVPGLRRGIGSGARWRPSSTRR